MTFSFRNRVRILVDVPQLYANAEELRLTNSNSDELVVIRSTEQDQMISETTELIVIGSGYQSGEAALNAGVKWRQVVSQYMARMTIPVELGDDDKENAYPREIEVTGDGLAMIGIHSGDVIYDEHRFGLYVYPTEPARRFVHIAMGTPNVVVSIQESEVRDGVQPALLRQSGVWGQELNLAYDLVHAAFANGNPEAKFILMVTAVEALIPYRQRNDPEVVLLLDSLISRVEGCAIFDVHVRDVVIRLLASDRNDSVRSFGLKLTERLTGQYANLTPHKYFDHAYGKRSELAHGNIREAAILGSEALNQQFAELTRFVLDILEVWTPDYSHLDTPTERRKDR